MDIPIANGGGAALSVSETVFGVGYKPALIHQIVTAYMAAARAGSKAQKTRSQVNGGNSKPYRQKGTGRARAGTTRSPIWRGGGKVFAATPRRYDQKVNRKMYRGALRSILSELVRQDRLIIVSEIGTEAPKTKLLAAWLADHDLADVLILTDPVDDRLERAANNLPNVDVLSARHVDPVSLIAFGKVVATPDAVKALEERFQ